MIQNLVPQYIRHGGRFREINCAPCPQGADNLVGELKWTSEKIESNEVLTCMVLNTSEIRVLKKSKWKDFVAEAGWKWPLKTGWSEYVWGEGDISMGYWGKSEKAVDPGKAGCDLCGRGGGHWTVGGWMRSWLDWSKGNRKEWSGQRGQARWSHTASTPDGRFWKPSARGLRWWCLPPPREITCMNLSDTLYMRPTGWCK